MLRVVTTNPGLILPDRGAENVRIQCAEVIFCDRSICEHGSSDVDDDRVERINKFHKLVTQRTDRADQLNVTGICEQSHGTGDASLGLNLKEDITLRSHCVN